MDANITERLRSILVDRFDGKPNAMADAVGVPRVTIVASTRPTNTSKPGFEYLYKIITNLGVDANWLLTGDGNMCDTKLHVNDNSLLPIMRASSLPAKQQIGELRVTDFVDAGAEFVTKVMGNDMAPLYPSGCLVALRSDKDLRHVGKVYLLIQKGDMPIMRRMYKSDDDSVILSASNSELYPDMVVSKSSIIASYIVVGCARTDF